MSRGHDNTETSTARPMPMKQKMALSLKSLISSAKKLTLGGDGGNDAGRQTASTPDALFARTTPETDGPECEHDCDACTVHYPRNFKIEEDDALYGHVKGFATHAIVATGKSDWVRDVEDEKGSVMQAVGKAAKPSNGRLMLSASNIPTPHHSSDYSEPTTVLLLPAFTIIDNVTPPAVPALITEFVDKAPTTDSPLGPLTLPRTVGGSAGNTTAGTPAVSEPATNGSAKGEAEAEADTKAENVPPATSSEDAVSTTTTKLPPSIPALTRRPCPHSALILLCSQKTRDARCGQSAPLLRRELERLLRPLGLFRDLDDERPGGVGIYFISHVGGHKYSANVMVYRRPDAFGLDGETLGGTGDLAALRDRVKVRKAALPEEEDVGAAQCIWLARIRPEDCENLIRYTVLQGKVVKPDRQLRGGFDRAKGLMSW